MKNNKYASAYASGAVIGPYAALGSVALIGGAMKATRKPAAAISLAEFLLAIQLRNAEVYRLQRIVRQSLCSQCRSAAVVTNSAPPFFFKRHDKFAQHPSIIAECRWLASNDTLTFENNQISCAVEDEIAKKLLERRNVFLARVTRQG
jgi:hypothetical protein